MTGVAPRVVAVAAGTSVGLGVAVGAVPTLLAGTVLVVGVLLLVTSRRWLWALALGLLTVVPLSYLPVPDALLTVTPSALVLLVLVVRLLLDGSGPRHLVVRPAVLLLLAAAAWLSVSALASEHRGITTGWLVSYGLLVVLPVVLATADPQARAVLRGTWVALGAVLGAYALVETFALRANPLLDPVYAGAARGALVQVWSVYRATTTLGHPVSNGTFFAIAVPLAIGLALRHRSGLAAVAAALAAGGVIASGTRASFAAALVGAAVVVLLPDRRGGRAAPAARAAAVAAIAVGLVLGSAYLAVRGASGEGASSAAFRTAQVPVALRSVEEAPLLGTGPGAASYSFESLLARIGGAGAFESYWLELAVGSGVPGLLLHAAVLVAAVVAALRSGAPDVAGAVVAWAVCSTFINALEGGRPEQLVLGLVLAMAFAEPPAPRRPQDEQPGRVGPGAVEQRTGAT